MTRAHSSRISDYDGDNTMRAAVRQALAAYNERYPDEVESVRANKNDDGDYEVTIRGSSDY